MPVARKLLNELSKVGISTAQGTNYRWSAEYSKRTSVLYVFLSRVSCSPLGMVLPRTSWVKVNRLRAGFGRFHSSMYKWCLAASLNRERGATDQTADHVISTCPIHRALRGVGGLTVLDDDTPCLLNTTTASIWYFPLPSVFPLHTKKQYWQFRSRSQHNIALSCQTKSFSVTRDWCITKYNWLNSLPIIFRYIF